MKLSTVSRDAYGKMVAAWTESESPKSGVVGWPLVIEKPAKVFLAMFWLKQYRDNRAYRTRNLPVHVASFLVLGIVTPIPRLPFEECAQARVLPLFLCAPMLRCGRSDGGSRTLSHPASMPSVPGSGSSASGSDRRESSAPLCQSRTSPGSSELSRFCTGTHRRASSQREFRTLSCSSYGASVGLCGFRRSSAATFSICLSAAW